MPEDNKTLAQIDEHRAQIDAIDEQLVTLLNERACHQLAIRALKPEAQLALFDPKREEEILQRAQSFNQGPLYSDNIREIFQSILKVSKEMPAE